MRIATTFPSTPETTEPEELRPGAKGERVTHAQNQLLHAGLSLPRYGADGDYGRETAAAVSRFQQLHGLKVTGKLDLETLRALENAPSPSPDYAALFSDGVLRAALAIGYDEAGSHEPEQARLLQGLAQRGYTWVADDQRASLGLDADGKFLTREQDGRRVILELITPDLDQPKARFAEAMRHSEVVMYGGHGRYGSGPDFDDIRSPAGNFVIGAPFEAGHVTLGPSDLAGAPLTPEYQLMFFDGCNTFRYFDELRAKKGTKTLDVLGSATELYWNVTAANLLTALDGVTSGETLEQLEGALDAVNRAGPTDQGRYFRGDGFEDN